MATFMRIYKYFVGIVALIALFLVIIIFGVRIFGIKPYTVLSGSMEPNYHAGSVIYVKTVNASELNVGDPITFDLNGLTVTHRIIEREEDEHGLRFYTQGDANNMPDGGFVTPDEVIGIPVLHIPYLGYVFDYIQHPPGIYIIVGGVAVLAIISFVQVDEDNKSENESQAETDAAIKETTDRTTDETKKTV